MREALLDSHGLAATRAADFVAHFSPTMYRQSPLQGMSTSAESQVERRVEEREAVQLRYPDRHVVTYHDIKWSIAYDACRAGLMAQVYVGVDREVADEVIREIIENNFPSQLMAECTVEHTMGMYALTDGALDLLVEYYFKLGESARIGGDVIARCTMRDDDAAYDRANSDDSRAVYVPTGVEQRTPELVAVRNAVRAAAYEALTTLYSGGWDDDSIGVFTVLQSAVATKIASDLLRADEIDDIIWEVMTQGLIYEKEISND